MADSLAVAELKRHIRNFNRGESMSMDPDAALQLSQVVRYVERLEKIAEAAKSPKIVALIYEHRGLKESTVLYAARGPFRSEAETKLAQYSAFLTAIADEKEAK